MAITLSRCVCMYVGMCVYRPMCIYIYISMIKRKPPDWNDLKLGTLVVLDALSKPIDLGFKRSRVRLS